AWRGRRKPLECPGRVAFRGAPAITPYILLKLLPRSDSGSGGFVNSVTPRLRGKEALNMRSALFSLALFLAGCVVAPPPAPYEPAPPPVAEAVPEAPPASVYE